MLEVRDIQLDSKCATWKVPDNQKILIKEIINAAKVSNPRGRQYSEEFIMLSLLMNIRSPSYYNFLRNNKIIPLKCMKTIRAYLSRFSDKCGFDEDFFKLHEKSFAAKDPKHPHGVVLLDEINLSKSIAVSAKNLTCTGLTDFGDDDELGPQSTDTKDLASHGLVLIFNFSNV